MFAACGWRWDEPDASPTPPATPSAPVVDAGKPDPEPPAPIVLPASCEVTNIAPSTLCASSTKCPVLRARTVHCKNDSPGGSFPTFVSADVAPRLAISVAGNLPASSDGYRGLALIRDIDGEAVVSPNILTPSRSSACTDFFRTTSLSDGALFAVAPCKRGLYELQSSATSSTERLVRGVDALPRQVVASRDGVIHVLGTTQGTTSWSTRTKDGAWTSRILRNDEKDIDSARLRIVLERAAGGVVLATTAADENSPESARRIVLERANGERRVLAGRLAATADDHLPELLVEDTTNGRAVYSAGMTIVDAVGDTAVETTIGETCPLPSNATEQACNAAPPCRGRMRVTSDVHLARAADGVVAAIHTEEAYDVDAAFTWYGTACWWTGTSTSTLATRRLVLRTRDANRVFVERGSMDLPASKTQAVPNTEAQAFGNELHLLRTEKADNVWVRTWIVLSLAP
jgi:hypothetical protein